MKKHVKRYAPLLAKFLKSEDDQVEVLLTLEEFCAEEGAFKDCQGKQVANAFAKILHLLYDADVLSESAILAWADEKDGADEKDLIFLKKALPFVKWLREAKARQRTMKAAMKTNTFTIFNSIYSYNMHSAYSPLEPRSETFFPRTECNSSASLRNLCTQYPFP